MCNATVRGRAADQGNPVTEVAETEWGESQHAWSRKSTTPVSMLDDTTATRSP